MGLLTVAGAADFVSPSSSSMWIVEFASVPLGVGMGWPVLPLSMLGICTLTLTRGGALLARSSS